MAQDNIPDKRKPNNIEKILREHGIQKYYVTNIIGGATKYDYRIELMNEKIKFKGKWTYLLDSIVILTPSAAKKLHKELSKYIEKYEDENGEIEESDEITNADHIDDS
jgi:hypothetical protein